MSDNTSRAASSGGDTLQDVDNGVSKTQVMRLSAHGQQVSRENPLPVSSAMGGLWGRFALQYARRLEQRIELADLMQQRLLLTSTPTGSVAVVVGISPSSGSLSGGTTVTIQVDSSIGAISASVGGLALIGFGIVDATHVSGVTQAHAAGATDVTVTNLTGTSAPLVGAFTYSSGAFAPLSIAGCVVWYDLAHNTNSGTTVTALPDQSGNARDATIVGGHEPGYTASSSAYNNQPIMSFATVEWATTPTTGITTGARTFVLVCDIGTAASCFAVCDDAFGIWVQGNGTDIGGAGDNANIIHGGALLTPSVVIFIDDGASSKLYISALTPVATGVDGGPQDLTGRVFTLGNCGFDLIAANSQVGSTAQFLLYDSALSPTDVAYLLAGFGAQFGIAIGP